MPDTTPLRPELLAALRLLARLSEALHRRGLPRPILVGGGAAEYYSGSALMTGDIDITSPVQPDVEAELTRLGFVKPEGLGHTPLGWVHPDLGLGFEIVASTPMDGSVDYRRLVLVEGLATDAAFVIIPIEDLIADRMGQFASGSAPEMLAQARTLFALHADLDMPYLETRVRHETEGDYGIEELR